MEELSKQEAELECQIETYKAQVVRFFFCGTSTNVNEPTSLYCPSSKC